MHHASVVWNHKILVTEFTEDAKNLYELSGAFINLKTSNGRRGYLRFNLSFTLPPKNIFYKKIFFLLKILDIFLNTFNDTRLFFWRSSFSFDEARIEYVNELDEETHNFSEQKQS